MRKFSKRSAVVASAVAVGAVIAGGVAFAAFQRQQEATAGTQGAETFKALGVETTWIGVRANHQGDVISTKLLPADSADVSLKIANPPENSVNGKVVSVNVVPLGLADVTGVEGSDRQYCKDALALKSYTPSNLVVAKSGGEQTVVLYDAAKLHPDTDIRCQNMSFPVKYNVTFAATRGAATPAVTSLS